MLPYSRVSVTVGGAQVISCMMCENMQARGPQIKRIT